jgi:hypothetical protein
VRYQGAVNDALTRIEGRWSIGENWSGAFFMARDDDGEAAATEERAEASLGPRRAAALRSARRRARAPTGAARSRRGRNYAAARELARAAGLPIGTASAAARNGWTSRPLLATSFQRGEKCPSSFAI